MGHTRGTEQLTVLEQAYPLSFSVAPFVRYTLCVRVY